MTVVNLRLARKAKARAEREAAAATNRALHGRSRADRAVQEIEATRATRLLDGHRLDNHRLDAPRSAGQGAAPSCDY